MAKLLDDKCNHLLDAQMSYVCAIKARATLDGRVLLRIKWGRCTKGSTPTCKTSAS